MSKMQFSDKAFFYLVFWCLGVFVLVEVYTDYLIYGYQLLTLFLLGFIGLYLYHYTRHSDELARWTMILLLSGLVILFLGYSPNLAELYLSSLATSPYITIGLTSLALGIVGILLQVLPSLVRALREWYLKQIIIHAGRSED